MNDSNIANCFSELLLFKTKVISKLRNREINQPLESPLTEQDSEFFEDEFMHISFAHKDLTRLVTLIKSLNSLFSHINNYLTKKHPEYEPRKDISHGIPNNPDDKHIYSEIHVHISRKDRDKISLNELKVIQKTLCECIEEINSTIEQVNILSSNPSIEAIILYNSEAEFEDGVYVFDHNISMFVYCYFKSNEETIDNIRTIEIEGKNKKIEIPLIQKQSVNFKETTTVEGYIELHSKDTRCFNFYGHYVDNGTLTEKAFEKEKIYVDASYKKTNQPTILNDLIDASSSATKIRVIFISNQYFVSHENIDCKKRIIKSFEIVD